METKTLEEKIIHIQVPAPREDDSSLTTFEGCWAKDLGNGLVEIRNVMFTTGYCTYGDICRINNKGEVTEVVKRTSQTAILRYAEEDEEGAKVDNIDDWNAEVTARYRHVLGYFVALGCNVEGMVPGMAALAVPINWTHKTLEWAVKGMYREYVKILSYTDHEVPDAPSLRNLTWSDATDNDKSEEVKEMFGSNNMDRAMTAMDALYAAVPDPIDFPTNIVDLTSDLMHLCRMNGVDFTELYRQALVHHHAEKEGEY